MDLPCSGPCSSAVTTAFKITPWKPMTVTTPFAESGESVYIKQGVYRVTGDLAAASAKGMELAGRDYSGSYELHIESMMFDARRQVAPAAESLKCGDCHAADSRLDFPELGYSAERAAELLVLGAGLIEEVAEAAPAVAPAEVPEMGGAPILPAWMVAVLAGVTAAATATALRRFRD